MNYLEKVKERIELTDTQKVLNYFEASKKLATERIAANVAKISEYEAAITSVEKTMSEAANSGDEGILLVLEQYPKSYVKNLHLPSVQQEVFEAQIAELADIGATNEVEHLSYKHRIHVLKVQIAKAVAENKRLQVFNPDQPLKEIKE